MTQKKYTPPPWRFNPYDGVHRRAGKTGFVVGESGTGTLYIIAEVNDVGDFVGNGPVIAASPYLLETCKAVLNEWRAIGTLSPSAVELLEAAIARAEGR